MRNNDNSEEGTKGWEKSHLGSTILHSTRICLWKCKELGSWLGLITSNIWKPITWFQARTNTPLAELMSVLCTNIGNDLCALWHGDKQIWHEKTSATHFLIFTTARTFSTAAKAAHFHVFLLQFAGYSNHICLPSSDIKFAKILSMLIRKKSVASPHPAVKFISSYIRVLFVCIFFR